MSAHNESVYPVKMALSNVTNTTSYLQDSFEIYLEDTNWILTSSFIIFTMQTGFGMLESGCVSIKNEANIMMKNVVDIVLGGLTYWIFGYGFSFGHSDYTNPFIGLGDFFIDPHVGDDLMGPVFAAFLFQLSFATTATTIVSGAMAERCNFKAYCLFSLLNTVVYCIPAGWVWGEHGFLYKMGAVDIAGSGPVHLIGGAASFASAVMLGPRLGRYSLGLAPLPLGSPVNAVMGLFVLWWGWLAFNSGSTYGVSGSKWEYAARAAVMTMMGSFGGGCFGLGYTLVRNSGRADVMDLINSILGSLVSVTAGCFLYRAWEALLIGFIGGAIASFSTQMFDRMRVDDPVGASAVHGCCGVWGVLAVGLFADNPIPLDTTRGRSGLFKGGGWYLLGVQALTAFCLATWGILSTMLLLWCVDKVIPIRMNPYDELLGADLTEHRVRHGNVGVSRALSALRPYHKDPTVEDVIGVGLNPGHTQTVDKFYAANHNGNTGATGDNVQLEEIVTVSGNIEEVPTSRHRQGLLNNRTSDTANAFNRKFNELQDTELPTLLNNVSQVFLTPDGERKGNSDKMTKVDMNSLERLASMQDRFRYRYSEEEYGNDLKRAQLAWID